MKNSISAPLPFGGFCLQWPPVNGYCYMAAFLKAHKERSLIPSLQVTQFHFSSTYMYWVVIITKLCPGPSLWRLFFYIVQPVFSTHLCKLENNKVGTLKLFQIRAIRVIFIGKVSLCVYNTCPYLVFFSFDFSPPSSLTFVVLWETLKT